MKMKRFIYVSALILCWLYFSCKKSGDDPADLKSTVARDLSVYGTIPVNSGDIFIANMNLVYPSISGVGFKALLTGAAKTEVMVTAKIDPNPDLLKIYDDLYHTHSPVLPASLFKIEGNGKIIVRAGQTESTDSIKVQLNDVSGLKLGNYTYVVPISMETNQEAAQLKSKMMFVRFKVSVVNSNTSITSLKGTSELNLPNSSNLDRNVLIQASISTELRQPVEIAVESETSIAFVNAYNSTHQTNYKPFPAGGYQLLSNHVTIPANQKVSDGNIQLQLADLSHFNLSDSYLMAVKIKDNVSAGPPVDPQKNIVYIVLAANNVDGSNSGLAGTVIDRTGWVVKTLGSYGGEPLPAENMLDGSNETSWISDGALPQWITLDMAAVQPVKGFSIVPNYLFINTIDFLDMEIKSSNDGTTWKFEGVYSGARTTDQSSPANPDLKTVKFITPVTARYFRFNVTRTTIGSYTGIAELYGIK